MTLFQSIIWVRLTLKLQTLIVESLKLKFFFNNFIVQLNHVLTIHSFLNPIDPFLSPDCTIPWRSGTTAQNNLAAVSNRRRKNITQAVVAGTFQQHSFFAPSRTTTRKLIVRRANAYSMWHSKPSVGGSHCHPLPPILRTTHRCCSTMKTTATTSPSARQAEASFRVPVFLLCVYTLPRRTVLAEAWIRDRNYW